jgi:hypothetical protein
MQDRCRNFFVDRAKNLQYLARSQHEATHTWNEADPFDGELVSHNKLSSTKEDESGRSWLPSVAIYNAIIQVEEKGMQEMASYEKEV